MDFRFVEASNSTQFARIVEIFRTSRFLNQKSNEPKTSKSVDSETNELVMFTTVDIQIDGQKNFFKQDEHQLAFKCKFSLDSQERGF